MGVKVKLPIRLPLIALVLDVDVQVSSQPMTTQEKLDRLDMVMKVRDDGREES